jgi:hypothetical protein
VTCRDEILSAVSELARLSPNGDFTVSDVVQHLQRQGSHYKESTIRTHVVSRMCANAPDHHGTVYDDLVRTAHGTYRLNSH